MHKNVKTYATVTTVFFVFLLAMISTASGTGSMTLTPAAQAPGASVSVAGTGFGAAKNVGIAFGSENQVVDLSYTSIVTSSDTRGYNFSRGPIKPGSIHLRLVALAGSFQGMSYDYSDDGQGNIRRDTTQAIWATVNYALGGYSNNSTGSPNDWEYYATFTYYQYEVISFGRANSTGSGAFAVNFTVPSVANGNYNVTAIDSSGNMATTTLSVSSTIPEVMPFGAILLLFSVAVMASVLYLRKRPKNENCNRVKV